MKCSLCNKDFNCLSRHVSVSHNMLYEDYLLKFVYDNVRPKCKCGCGNDAPFTSSMGMSFKDYIHGHHMKGKKRSEETKNRIGVANSIKMTEYMKNHPGLGEQRNEQMLEGITTESEIRRIETLKQTYAAMSKDDKQKFVNHANNQWQNHREKMLEAGKRGSEVFKERIKNGEYDFTERNDKLSKIIAQKYLDGGFEWSRGDYTSVKMNETFHYRSSWELEYMKTLDNDSDVISWDYEPFIIEYTFKDKAKRYLPDFTVIRVNDIRELIEVKPESLIDTEMNTAKAQAAQRWCNENGYVYKTWSLV